MGRSEVDMKPFKLGNPPTSPFRRAVRGLFQPAIERALQFDTLNRLYAHTQANRNGAHFCERALEALNVTCQVPPESLAHVPTTGPLVVVANHPFGGLEGLMLEALLRRVRPDVKLLANYMLKLIPDLRDSFFFVDPFGHPDSARRNLSSIRAAVRWVKQGHALGSFPSGEVARLTLRDRGIVEPPWSAMIARIVQITGATVVPVYFEGRNSNLFHLLGLLHPLLRTVLLPRELLKKQHSMIAVGIGSPIGPDKLARFEDPKELTNYLRVRTYILKSRRSSGPKPAAAEDPAGPAAPPVPIAAAKPTDVLAREVDALPAEQHLVDSGKFSVSYFRADQAPNLLHEIGRLREVAFRAVGEGTGTALDIDPFDAHYLHLFVWNRQTNEIVGSYRGGLTDEILETQGKKGLYTSTLFQYKTRLLEQIGPALEMGRSFVRPEYQRNHSPLSLLWRGIARFVSLHPRYKMLFGPVSISNKYSSLSKQLLVAFLQQNRSLPALAQWIKAKTPPRFRPIRDWSGQATSVVVRGLEEVDELIGEIEADMKSMPVLLRQYLKLNSKLLGFNVDPDFGDVLDALMLTDLTQISRAVLVRYMGRKEAEAFLAHHGETF